MTTDSSSTSSEARRTDWLVGLAVYGSALTGIVGLVLAVWSFLSGRWEAAGAGLVAGAVAFGALANALLRR